MNEWTISDAAEFRDFLAKPAGKKLFEMHDKARPRVESKDFQAVSLEAFKSQGWEDSHDWFAEKANFNEQPQRAPAFIENMEKD